MQMHQMQVDDEFDPATQHIVLSGPTIGVLVEDIPDLDALTRICDYESREQVEAALRA